MTSQPGNISEMNVNSNEQQQQVNAPGAASVVESTGNTIKQGLSRRAQKRKRRRSNEANALKAGTGAAGSGGAGGEMMEGEERGGSDDKRPRNRQMSISSKVVANHVMKTRLLGSESDPLNLEGVSSVTSSVEKGREGGTELTEMAEEFSTHSPSPVFIDCGQPVLLPTPLVCNPRDPLNLEGRLPENSTKGTGGYFRKRGGKRRAMSCPGDGDVCSKQESVGGRKGGWWARGGRGRGGRRRKSHSKKMETNNNGSIASTSGTSFGAPVFKPEDQRYCYGNYDMYYGYRCASRGGMMTDVNDPRIALMKKEWFEGKLCLDIGSNTGQITLTIAQQFNPQRIVGIDIDHKLVRIANKNLFRNQVPSVAPDGRAFPSSFTSKASFSILSSKTRSHTPHQSTVSQSFPYNVEFAQENYVPTSEAEVVSTQPQYDVILALSITKWVHLNWGDVGLRRMFQKMFRHLRPGGKLIIEPQPFSSYARKKKLTPAIYKNYYAIKFHPNQFQTYLLSDEVGFKQHRFIGTPHHKSEGFRRPIYVYIKTDQNQQTIISSRVEGVNDIESNNMDINEEEGGVRLGGEEGTERRVVEGDGVGLMTDGDVRMREGGGGQDIEIVKTGAMTDHTRQTQNTVDIVKTVEEESNTERNVKENTTSISDQCDSGGGMGQQDTHDVDKTSGKS